MPNPKTLFVLADGARARLVERSHDTGDFVTFVEIDARDRLRTLRTELRAGLPGRTQQSGTPERHAVGREDYIRLAKQAFIEQVAERAADVAEARGFQDVVVAAPARLIEPLRKGLARRAHIAGSLERDLTKAPDEALPKWLDHVFQA